MEVVRHFLNSNLLAGILPLPDSLSNRRVEVIVLPVEPEAPAKENGRVEEILQSLVGAIPCVDMTPEELREERLQKYEAAD